MKSAWYAKKNNVFEKTWIINTEEFVNLFGLVA